MFCRKVKSLMTLKEQKLSQIEILNSFLLQSLSCKHCANFRRLYSRLSAISFTVNSTVYIPVPTQL